MDPEIINATYLRLKTRDLMERVHFQGIRFIVKTFGRPMAVIISYDDFLRIKDLLVPITVPNSAKPNSATGNRVRRNKVTHDA